MSSPPGKRVPAPASVRIAGLIVALQGGTGLAAAVVLLWRGVRGADQGVANGFGTAVWFLVVGGAVLAAGWALSAGKRWGRGPAVFVQLLLLPVAWYLAVDSHRQAIGIAVGAVALVTLLLLLNHAAVQWVSNADQRGSARCANSGPDSR